MQIVDTNLKEVKIIVPSVYEDERGYFMETYHQERYTQQGIGSTFVQDNLSYSQRGVVRGLHYQLPHAQVKMVQVLQGEIFDVAVDIRQGSSSFGKWTGVFLSDENKRQMYIPEGFAHGFCVVSETVLVTYKCSDFYSPESEKGLLWSDSDLGIEWPVENPIVSEKDRQYVPLKQIPSDQLPQYKK